MRQIMMIWILMFWVLWFMQANANISETQWNTYKLGNTTGVNIYKHQICRNIANTSSSEYFIPLWSWWEFNSFIDHKPNWVTINNCTITTPCMKPSNTVWWLWSPTSITQTLSNGTTWTPLSVAGTYSATATVASCRFTCASGYAWDNGSCKEITYSYSYWNWSNCSASPSWWAWSTCTNGSQSRLCQNTNGIQTRTASCIRSSDGATVLNTLCSGTPQTTQTCPSWPVTCSALTKLQASNLAWSLHPISAVPSRSSWWTFQASIECWATDIACLNWSNLNPQWRANFTCNNGTWSVSTSNGPRNCAAFVHASYFNVPALNHGASHNIAAVWWVPPGTPTGSWRFECNDGVITTISLSAPTSSCWSAQGWVYVNAPSSSLCNVGTPSWVTNATDTTWNWSCTSWWTSVQCIAIDPLGPCRWWYGFDFTNNGWWAPSNSYGTRANGSRWCDSTWYDRDYCDNTGYFNQNVTYSIWWGTCTDYVGGWCPVTTYSLSCEWR